MAPSTAPYRHEGQAWRAGLARVAGVDEAGRGPLAGPVVAAAVVVTPEHRIRGVADSKLLSSERWQNLRPLEARELRRGIHKLDEPCSLDRCSFMLQFNLAIKVRVGNGWSHFFASFDAMDPWFISASQQFSGSA